MTTSDNFKRSLKMLKDSSQYVPYGSEGHKRILEGGYGMTVEQAEAIITERAKEPMAHSLDDLKKAKSLLAALKSKPTVISNKPGHRRRGRYALYGEAT